MKKKLLVSGALALTCASCLALAGCDLFGSSSGNNGGNNGGGGTVTGPTVTEDQWENAFGNERYSKNFTTDISATVTVETSDGEEDGVSRATGLFRVDGGKNYSSVEANGYLMEMYELHNSADDYTWVRFGDSSVWEQESVNGLPLSAVMLADYVDCYDCFEYDSKTKSYIATDSGRRHLTDIFVRSQVGELPASEEISFELTEASFTLSNGLPIAAHMRFVIDEKSKDGRWAHIDQNLNYTFSYFGKTTVSYPAQIQEWLENNGIDVDEPSKEDPVNPTPSGKLTEKEWRNIFENEKNYENYTGEFHVEAHVTAKAPTGETESERIDVYMKLLTDGDKFYGYMNDNGNDPEEDYALRKGGKFHSWRYNEKGELEHDESNLSDVKALSLLTFSLYSDCYDYFTYNPATNRYEATDSGLKVLLKVVQSDTANNEMVFQMCDSLAECSFTIENGKVTEAKMVGTIDKSQLGLTMKGEITMTYAFSDYGKTTVTFPAEIQKQIDSIGGGSNLPVEPDNPDKPDNPDNPDDKPVVSEGTKGLEYSLNSDGKGYSVNGIGTAKGTVIVIPAEYNDLPVTEIRNNAFQYNETVTSVVISEGVSTVGSGAFRGCSALESIVIAKSVTSIGSSAFRYCDSLTAVYYAGSATDWEAVNIGSSNSPLTKAEVYFYSTVKKTGNYWHYVADTPVKW